MSLDTRSQQSLVSVIIPTYNRQSYLKEAIASAVRQTYHNIEIIVSDDCSSESPDALVESFQDPRIRFRRNATNLGIGLNVTNAFKEARGKYVASLNDDDIWNEDFLEKLVPHLDANPNLALAFCDYYVIDSNSKIDELATEKRTGREKRDHLKEGIYQPFYDIGLVDQAVFSASAAVIRKDVVEWDKLFEAGVFWDLYTIYLACRNGHGAYYCPERLSRYREHAQSENMISGSRNVQAKIRKGKAAVFCYERFMEDDKLQKYRHYFKQELAHANTTLGIGLLRTEQVAQARPYLLRALSQQKFNLRTIAALTLSFIPQPLARPFLFIQNKGRLSKIR